jgi:hypothetical protein
MLPTMAPLTRLGAERLHGSLSVPDALPGRKVSPTTDEVIRALLDLIEAVRASRPGLGQSLSDGLGSGESASPKHRESISPGGPVSTGSRAVSRPKPQTSQAKRHGAQLGHTLRLPIQVDQLAESSLDGPIVLQGILLRQAGRQTAQQVIATRHSAIEQQRPSTLEVRQVWQHVKEGLLLSLSPGTVLLHKLDRSNWGPQDFDPAFLRRRGGPAYPDISAESSGTRWLDPCPVPHLALAKVGLDAGMIT